MIGNAAYFIIMSATYARKSFRKILRLFEPIDIFDIIIEFVLVDTLAPSGIESNNRGCHRKICCKKLHEYVLYIHKFRLTYMLR